MMPPEDAVAASTMTGQSLPIASDPTMRRYVRSMLRRHRAATVIVLMPEAYKNVYAGGAPICAALSPPLLSRGRGEAGCTIWHRARLARETRRRRGER